MRYFHGLFLLCLFASPAFAGFEAGDVLLRGRGIVVSPQGHGTVSRPIGGQVYLSKAAVPEVDATYFFGPHWAIEGLVGAIPHDVKVKNSRRGEIDAGSIWVVGPMALLQYHAPLDEVLSTYFGAGGAYGFFVKNSSKLNVEYHDSAAFVMQAGLNIQVADDWFANIDIKRAWLGATADINGGRIKAQVDLNPWLVGVGLGYRF